MSAASAGAAPSDALSKHTAIFGLRLWVVIGVGCGAAFVLALFLLSLWFTSRRGLKPWRNHRSTTNVIPEIPRDIPEIRVDSSTGTETAIATTPLADFLQHPLSTEIGTQNGGCCVSSSERQALFLPNRIQIDIGKENRISYPGGGNSLQGSGDQGTPTTVLPEVSHLGWGHWYTLRELEAVTNMFDPDNVIGEGGYGIVYHGVLADGTQVAVKNLLNNRGQAEREFKVEVEAIGRVRHKNLVRLLGYCMEGAHRILVYEYVDNGNLEQWLHGDVGPVSPLTWDIRMKIIIGTAKGLMYLHDGLEPKVVHRDIKSSNILLDKDWNPKVSDFGLAKLLGAERTYVTTRVMGTFGYVAPEYASTGMLNERSDVYSFGILTMEIISGRTPVDYSRQPGEVNLVDWLKTMVSNRDSEGVLDPKITEKPSSRALKKVMLVALKCVDPDSQKRPKMGHIIHMLEVDDFPYRDDRRAGRDSTFADSPKEKVRVLKMVSMQDDQSSGNETESNTQNEKPPSRRKQED